MNHQHPSVPPAGPVAIIVLAFFFFCGFAACMILKGCVPQHATARESLPLVSERSNGSTTPAVTSAPPSRATSLAAGVHFPTGHVMSYYSGARSVECAAGTTRKGSTHLARRDLIVTDDLLERLSRIESNGNTKAIGDHGRSLGLFQFTPEAWTEVNNLRARQGLGRVSLSARTNPNRARSFASAYLQKLHNDFSATQGKEPTRAQLYALWNLGPRGFQRRGFSLSNCPEATQRAARRME